MKLLTKNDLTKLVVIVTISIILFAVNPFQLTLNQGIILSSLFFTIAMWTLDIVKKRYVSTFLLTIFLIFSNTELKAIFRFPISKDFVMILYAFLFSQGIVHSRVASIYSGMILKKYGNTPVRLIGLGILFSILFIFIIPQPFARVILLAAIYKEYLKETNVDDHLQEVIIYSLFVFATCSYMLFRSGDIILNRAFLGFGGQTVSDVEWLKYMFVPSFITGILIFIAYLWAFRSVLKQKLPSVANRAIEIRLERKEKIALLIILSVVLLWMTEPFHHINEIYVIIAGTLAFFLIGFVTKEDLKSINIDLLFFLTAAFAIGPVMTKTGIPQVVFENLTQLFPANYSIWYIIVLIVCTMVLHMLLGSTITTLSIVIPGFLQLTSGIIDPLSMLFITYISVNIHYLLPFHHVTIMIGSGNKLFENKTVMKFGVYLTLIVFISIVVLYLPWWEIVGLL